MEEKGNAAEKHRLTGKNDRILIGVIIVIALVSLFIVRYMNAGGTNVVITQNGEVYGTYDLKENEVIYVDTKEGTNTVKIQDGVVTMIEASCPDQICVHTYPISETEPGSIICLPHKLIVEIKE